MQASLPVLAFHAIEDRPSVISFSPELLRRGLARLHAGGYRTVSLLEAAECVRRGGPFPDRSFVITFDDGYRSVYSEAFPILRRCGMSATVFLTVGARGGAGSGDRLPSFEGRPMLSWSEMREMQRYGIAFGAHTLTHPDLTRLPFEQVEAEVVESQAIIQDALGGPVACFAYPYGRYDRRSRDVVRQRFACACSDKLGLMAPGSDVFALERVDAYYLRKDRLFSLMPSRLFPWYIRACSVPRGIRRALRC